MTVQLQICIPAKPAYSYPILIRSNLINDWHEWLPTVFKAKQITIITDSIVANLYSKKFAKCLEQHGYQVLLLKLNPGEVSKNLQTKEYIESEMLKHKFDRHSLCIAFGGGVIGDLAGFIASTYMRGIKYIQMPTSLLAMVDSSVGGKTAINTPYGKNLIGTFWQPIAVIIDTGFLQSLPYEHIINGLIESLKIFLTSDEQSFRFLLNNLDEIVAYDINLLESIIKRSVSLKAEIISIDEKEENLRMVLNFGHTIGHAIEKVSDYKILHGYAVALGILVESKIANLMGYLVHDDYLIIKEILKKLGITETMLSQYPADAIIAHCLNDKKNRDGKIFCVLLKQIGSVYSENGMFTLSISKEIIYSALKTI